MLVSLIPRDSGFGGEPLVPDLGAAAEADRLLGVCRGPVYVVWVMPSRGCVAQ